MANGGSLRSGDSRRPRAVRWRRQEPRANGFIVKIGNEGKSEYLLQDSSPETQHKGRTLEGQDRGAMPRHAHGRSSEECEVPQNPRKPTRQLDQLHPQSPAELPRSPAMYPRNPDP